MPKRRDGLAQESTLNTRDKVRYVYCSLRMMRAATPHLGSDVSVYHDRKLVNRDFVRRDW